MVENGNIKYIRYIMETYLLMLISSLTEISRSDTSNKSRLVSFGLAILILCFLGTCIICSIFLSVVSYPSLTRSKITSKLCRQCFSDIKDSCQSRLMSVLFFMRRILLCVVVIIFKNTQLTTKLIIFVSIQSLYMLAILIIRPFEKMKNFMLEMINEIFYLLLCCLLFRYNTENNWTNQITQIYLWVMISNNVLFAFISFVAAITNCLLKSKTKTTPKSTNQTIVQLKYQDESPQIQENMERISEAKENFQNYEKNAPVDSSSNHISIISFEKLKQNNRRVRRSPKDSKLASRRNNKKENFNIKSNRQFDFENSVFESKNQHKRINHGL